MWDVAQHKWVERVRDKKGQRRFEFQDQSFDLQ